MSNRRHVLQLYAFVGGLYGLLLGIMTGFMFPEGAGLGALLGLLIGYGHTLPLRTPPQVQPSPGSEQPHEPLKGTPPVRMGAEHQFRVPLHGD